ncbi:Uncharacterized protein SCF082_LOCUS3959 [Durusdinium trenchii]|uniref:CSC1/OSCA1-like cytosolic domain-containing protein n=1 Tax=Durusdinium trenchii TaxID=1381693 RepID=A0ABP0HXS7_9DINO
MPGKWWVLTAVASAAHEKDGLKDVIEAATKSAVQMIDKLEGACGASAVETSDGFVPPKGKTAECWVEQYTNCTMSYTQIRCPDSCPMVAASPSFPCIFTCVTPEECAEYSPGHARPDFELKLCTPCSVLGCRYCTSHTECKECFPGFVLEHDRCTFYMDAHGISATVLKVLVVLIAFLVMVVLICYCRGYRSEHADENLRNMIEARRHRRLCKLHKWDRTSEKTPRRWFDLSVSMMKDDIAGWGLVKEGLCTKPEKPTKIGSRLYAPAGLQKYLPMKEEVILDKMLDAFKKSETTPAVLFSPLVKCAHFTPELRAEALQDFAEHSFWTLCAMWGFIFVLSLQQSYSCYHFYTWFDEQNVDSSDYAVLLTGLPASTTNEAQLQKMLEKQLRQHMELDEGDIHGVSIAYDLSDFTLRTEVETILSNITRHKEFQIGAFEGRKSWTSRMFEWEKQQAEDKEKTERMFNDGRLKSVGRAFVVFNKASKRDEVLEKYGVNKKVIEMPELPNVEIEGVDFDPVSVFWENQHNTDSKVGHNAVKGALKVVAFFLIVNALIILPYNVFVVGVFMSSGADLAGPSQTIAGLLLGIVNQQISAQVYNQAWFAGFKKKDRFDTFIFVLNTTVQFFNTWLGLGVTAWAVIGKEGGTVEIFSPLVDTGNIGLEAAIGDAFYAMHVPGVLYVNYIMGLLMGGVVPFAQHTLVGKIIYVWRSLPDCLLRALKLILPWAPDDLERYPRFNAEKAIEAPEMGVAWDYSAFIVHIATAFLVTAVVSASVWKLFVALSCWCLFFSLWSRFMHLRVQTASSFNGHLLDTAGWLLWSLPMGCLAGSIFVWAVRSKMVPEIHLAFRVALLVLAMILGAALWVMAYLLIIQPFRRSDAPASQHETVEEVMRMQPFSWYNCNPAYVLKCAYMKELVPDSHLSGNEALLYRRGKEYLFIEKDKQQGRKKGSKICTSSRPTWNGSTKNWGCIHG